MNFEAKLSLIDSVTPRLRGRHVQICSCFDFHAARKIGRLIWLQVESLQSHFRHFAYFVEDNLGTFTSQLVMNIFTPMHGVSEFATCSKGNQSRTLLEHCHVSPLQIDNPGFKSDAPRPWKHQERKQWICQWGWDSIVAEKNIMKKQPCQRNLQNWALNQTCQSLLRPARRVWDFQVLKCSPKSTASP